MRAVDSIDTKQLILDVISDRITVEEAKQKLYGEQ